MTRSEHNPWLNRFAVFVAINTLMLIGIGGLVTSKGVGMAVPDWPTTYGYNMFFFPFHLWKGGIFYEHSHRLFGAWVGLLTLALAGWLWAKESRAGLRRLGLLALGLVILQGVLGGLRVVWLKDSMGIIHAALAQGFLALLASIALFTSSSWQRLTPGRASPGLRNYLALAAVCIFGQLLLGAAMRHQHSGLAVPDFPLAYGRLYPPTDPEFLRQINQAHADVTITAFQVHLHMAHRLGALILLILSVWVSSKAWRATPHLPRFRKGVICWQALIAIQALLGAITVWTGKAADIATLHVVVGALCLVAVVMLALAAHRLAGVPVPASDIDPSLTRTPQPSTSARPASLADAVSSQ